MQINLDLQQDEAEAVKRLLSAVLDTYGGILRPATLSGSLRVAYALGLALQDEQAAHYAAQVERAYGRAVAAHEVQA